MARVRRSPPRVYRSRVDLFLMAPLALVGVVMTASVVAAAIDEGPLRAMQAGAVALAVVGLIAWLVLGTHYLLQDGDLLIRSGPMRWRIPLDSIVSIEPARGFMRVRSAPALSMQRLAIVYGGGRTVLVSPADRDRFLADIRSRQTADQ